MSTDLELIPPTELLDVRTGELVEATPAKAAELIVAARELRQRLLDLVKDCETVLLEESRRQGTKTLHYPDGTATITGGQTLEWDMDVLDILHTELGLPAERFDQLVVATVSYKVNAAIAKQLEAANPAYAEVIGAARRYDPKPWRVSVK